MENPDCHDCLRYEAQIKQYQEIIEKAEKSCRVYQEKLTVRQLPIGIGLSKVKLAFKDAGIEDYVFDIVVEAFK